MYVSGCGEHYLVHIMRNHRDLLPELAPVLEVDHQVVGNIMDTKTKLIDEEGAEKAILTFGPVSILPVQTVLSQSAAVLRCHSCRLRFVSCPVTFLYGFHRIITTNLYNKVPCRGSVSIAAAKTFVWKEDCLNKI